VHGWQYKNYKSILMSVPMAEKITAYIDGGSRGNPGPAAAAFILTDQKAELLGAEGLFIGRSTNNVAEYTGLIKALEAASQISCKQITVFSDSQFMVRQINGQYKVKSENIRPLYQHALGLLGQFESWQLKHIARDENTQADSLVNRALDAKSNVTMKQSTSAKNQPPVRLGVLISGGGTTLLNILDYIKEGKLNTQVSVVISSRSTVAGVKRAKNAGLNVKIIRRKDYADIDQFSNAIETELNAARVDLVVQGGWLCLWKIPPRYENRVMNIHPALLPSFGGRGMWGHHVHEAVLKTGCKISGCTVHFCTNEYDKGPIIVQRCCPVEENDTAESLAGRVFEQECIAYPQAIRLFQENRLINQHGKVKIKK
jgi:formyltetrahydrofolate-dependent phosphoribosylglycinamide formyltransferase